MEGKEKTPYLREISYLREIYGVSKGNYNVSIEGMKEEEAKELFEFINSTYPGFKKLKCSDYQVDTEKMVEVYKNTGLIIEFHKEKEIDGNFAEDYTKDLIIENLTEEIDDLKKQLSEYKNASMFISNNGEFKKGSVIFKNGEPVGVLSEDLPEIPGKFKEI